MRGKIVLAIGGTDPDGGAGVYADLRTLAALGVYGAAVVSAVLAQNTRGVQRVLYMPASLVRAQLESVFSDVKVDAVKIGMLGTREIVEEVARELRKRKTKHIVLDPVFTAQPDGKKLIEKNAIETMRKKIIPLAEVITPNVNEAEMLAEMEIRNVEDAKRAARVIRRMGARNVVVKGVRSDGGVVDVVLVDGEFHFFRKKIVSGGTHGGGCVFASAIAANLVKGMSARMAIEGAERFIGIAIAGRKKIGKGVMVVGASKRD